MVGNFGINITGTWLVTSYECSDFLTHIARVPNLSTLTLVESDFCFWLSSNPNFYEAIL